MLEVSGVRKVFHANTANARIALDGVDLELAEGDFAVIIGGNGAGKSTLLNAIAGEVRVDSGRIAIAGAALTALPTHRRAAQVARVFQDPVVGTAGSMTIAENLAVAALRGQRRNLRRGLRRAQREDFAARLRPLGLGLETRLDTKVEMLSGGQRQALCLLMAVLRRPALVLLDEHTAALDPRTADIVMTATLDAIASAGLTALMVTHNMRNAIDYGKRLLMMSHGRIVLDLTGAAKANLGVADLVERFKLAHDRLLLED
ncbi:MAG: ATP-binding cassette domain-containing protein [Gammaproteobacteria bacterium]